MNPIVDEEYLDLIIDSSVANLYADFTDMENIFVLNPKFSIVLIPASLFNMCLIETFPYAFFPPLYTLSAVIASDSNVEKVQSNPNFALFGQGVLVGIVDTGIDYQHPAFRYSDGSSRIHSIWDQTINDDTTEGFLPYGTIYSKEMINQALKSSNPLSIVPSVDENGHGTSIAGIIGGSYNLENQFKSIVPQCEFIVVKLKPAKKLNKEIFSIPADKLCYQATDIIAGLNYVTTTAYDLRKPISVCLALGTSQSGHDGRGAISGYLEYLTQGARIGISVAGGNEGNKRRHVFRTIISPYYEDIELNISEQDISFAFEIWGKSPYRLSIDVISPTGEIVRDIYPRLRECRKLEFIFTPCTVYVNNIITESISGDQLILVRFEKSFSGIWRFRIYSIDEKEVVFDAWLPSGNLISDDTYFLNSDPDSTILAPGTAYSPLTIANYNPETGSIAIDSSRGYTRYNIIKPDLAAPGQNIRCPVPNNGYSFLSGTGAAAAHSTGVIAMFLEWAVVRGNYTVVSGVEINNMLIRGAQRQEDLEYPNRSWGYGAMDIYGTFEKLI